MKPDQIRHLLGGYATGTLTPEEQKTLFDAALQDQSLFEALAKEQALKETLDGLGIRRELMEALESVTSWRERARAWMRWQIPVAATGILAAAALTVIAITRYSRPLPQPSGTKPAQVAVARPPSMPSSGGGQADERFERMLKKEKPVVTPSQPTRTKKAATPELAAPAAIQSEPVPPPPASAASAVESAPPRAMEESKALRSSLLASEQGSQMGSSNVARELFYASPSQPAGRLAKGVEGGVAGGSPAAQIARGRAKPSAADSLSSDQAAPGPSPQALGLRYSGRDAQRDPPQLVVESNTDAVLYIFRRGESGEWLPVTAGGMSLKARTPATSPAIGVDGNAPAPRTLLLLSRTPLTELAQTGPALSAAIERLRAQTDVSQVLTQAGSGSTYVVMPRPKPGSTLVVPVTVP